MNKSLYLGLMSYLMASSEMNKVVDLNYRKLNQDEIEEINNMSKDEKIKMLKNFEIEIDNNCSEAYLDLRMKQIINKLRVKV